MSPTGGSVAVSDWRNSSKVIWVLYSPTHFIDQNHPCLEYGSQTADVNRLHTEMSKMFLPGCDVSRIRFVFRI